MYGIAGLLTGRSLCGRYRIDAVIGRGGMGAVYRATDERLGRAVAVKVIGITAADPGEHGRLQARFLREARAAAGLHHPNVVSVYDFGTDDAVGLDFLVMELLTGEDLAVRLARTGPPPMHVSLSILRQAARGLAAGHRVGLVHRDVKPGNLFLETSDHADEPHVRVLDFGIAQLSGDEGTMTHLTEFGRSPFSPAFASPEQMRGEQRLTPSSDVFSLGAVGYNLLTGVRPFTSSDAVRMAEEVAEAVRALPERAPDVEPRVREALARALSIHPLQRFSDATAFADALTHGVSAPAAAPSVAGPAAAAASAIPVAAPPPLPPRRARAPLGAVSVEPDEGTRLQTVQPGPAARPVRPVREATVPPAFAPPRAATVPPPATTSFAPPPLAQQLPALHAHAATPAAAMAAQRPGGVRRFFRGLWDLTVTTAVMALFVGAWVLAGNGVMQGRTDQIYAGAAASVLFTPLAVHRLTGRRGRYRFALFGSIIATATAVYYVGRDTDPAILLAAMFGMQVVTSFVMARLTRRRVITPPFVGY
ncbi:MAG TPA: serine/threonine-protein kinase [Longimicrobium sp.]|jgi:serine/threonine-protein kinase|uniref:serine/threonine-protein kinase n=1 Tax=Longimicrobium sp. TaxID=2029185 RepID=UPI002EDAAAD3